MDDLFVFPDEKVRVIHVHDRLGKPYEVYCGRPNPHYGFVGSPLCNPFPADSERERNRVCDEYEHYFVAQIQSGFELFTNELERLVELYYSHGKLDLMCWCKPKRCHCDTIQRYLYNKNNNMKYWAFAVSIAALSQTACVKSATQTSKSVCIYHVTKLPPRNVLRTDLNGGVVIEQIPVYDVACELRHPSGNA